MADELIERLNAGVLRTRTNMIPLVDHATDTMAEAAQAIAALTAENEHIEVERVKLWNERRDAVSAYQVALAAADTMQVERDAFRAERDALREALQLAEYLLAEDGIDEGREQIQAALKGDPANG